MTFATIQTMENLCKCGCGAVVAGTWAQGHNPKANWKLRTSYVVEDRGYATPCHIWQGVASPQGYGRRWFGGKQTTAHRSYYEERYGPIPEGVVIDHLCDQKLCVNTDHLRPTTRGLNVARSTSREAGTSRKIKLTTAQVEEIRAIVGRSQSDIAKEYGVSQAHISKIRRGRPNANGEKITADQIEEIRSSSLPAAQISEQYEISTALVYTIRRGEYRRPKPLPEPTTVITLSLPTRIVAKVEGVAVEQGTTRSALLRNIVSTWHDQL